VAVKQVDWGEVVGAETTGGVAAAVAVVVAVAAAAAGIVVAVVAGARGLVLGPPILEHCSQKIQRYPRIDPYPLHCSSSAHGSTPQDAQIQSRAHV